MDALIRDMVKDYMDSPCDILNDSRWEIYETFSDVPKSEMYSVVLCCFFDEFISTGDKTAEQKADYIRDHLGVILNKYMGITGLDTIG